MEDLPVTAFFIDIHMKKTIITIICIVLILFHLTAEIIDIAYDKTISVSSEKPATGSLTYGYENIRDGSDDTCWSNALSDDTDWVQIDLHDRYPVKGMYIRWKGAYATHYAVDISNDGEEWRRIYVNEKGTGGVNGSEEISFHGLHLKARFVKLVIVKKHNARYVTIYDLKVFGIPVVQEENDA